MKRLFAFFLLVTLCAPAALAQQADLVGTWNVERLADPNAEPAAEGSISALLPDNPYTLSPVRLRLGVAGDATVSMLMARQGGYDVTDVATEYHQENGQLTIPFGDFETDWVFEQREDLLVLTAWDGSMLTLRLAHTLHAADRCEVMVVNPRLV